MASSVDEASLLLENSAAAQPAQESNLDAERQERFRQKKELARELQIRHQKRRRLMEKACTLVAEDLLDAVVSRAASAKAGVKANSFS